MSNTNVYNVHGGPCTSRTRRIHAESWRDAIRIAAERDARRLYRTRGVLGPERVTDERSGWVRISVFIGRTCDAHSLVGRSHLYDVTY